MDDPGGQNTDNYPKRPNGSGSTGVDYSMQSNHILSYVQKGIRKIWLLVKFCKSTFVDSPGIPLFRVDIFHLESYLHLCFLERFEKPLGTK